MARYAHARLKIQAVDVINIEDSVQLRYRLAGTLRPGQTFPNMLDPLLGAQQPGGR
jgi:hypothetical protein